MMLGVYRLTPESCYHFAQDTYVYDTANPVPLNLDAKKFLLKGTIVQKQV